MKTPLMLLLILLMTSPAQHTEGLRLLREGNRLFEEGNFSQAEEKFRKALEKDSNNTKALFNLGNSLYRQGRLGEAAEVFETLNHLAGESSIRADALHNLGNSQLGAGKIPESIESYKESLRLNPEDEDTRYNLAYAMKLLEEMPPEHQEAPGEKGDQEHDEQQQEGQPEGQEEDQQPEDARPDEMPGDPETEELPSGQLSPEDAERILDALNRQEQNVQENVKRKADTTAVPTPRRNW